MRQLLARARKRVIGHLVLDKGALALAIGMGGVVLLLLAGTQILDWYWPVLLAAVSLGIGVYQLRKFIPSVYVLAQRIDNKMGLADSLSTAVYFSEHPKPGLESVCAVQFQEADRLAASVNLEQALPLARSRYLAPALVLLVAASGLFVTRYLMTGSVDLRASLLEMVVDNFFASPAEETIAKAARPDLKPRAFDPSQPDSPQAQEEVQQELPPDAQKGNELKSDASSDANSGEGEKGPGDPEDQNAKQDEGGDSKDGPPQDKQADQKESGGDDKGQSDSQGQDQRSMMDKLRDAVNNLMNKMNSDPPQKGAPKSGKQQQAKNQDKGEKSQEKGEQSEGDPQSDQQGDQGDPKDAKQSNAPGQKTSEEAKSGAGQDDGKKDIENAKALEAMGKVSELLGERSASISGDLMIEVGTTKQQLKTAMTQQSAGHTDAGGEIHRDQVPLAYQTFVERYFQEVRKTPAKGAQK